MCMGKGEKMTCHDCREFIYCMERSRMLPCKDFKKYEKGKRECSKNTEK